MLAHSPAAAQTQCYVLVNAFVKHSRHCVYLPKLRNMIL